MAAHHIPRGILTRMYAQHFGLEVSPFSIAPDPRYLFMSERHREALAHLLYGVSAGGGFVLLTGEIGAGKTTICRSFLEQIPTGCKVAYIFNPKLTVEELLDSICGEFGAQPVQTQGRTASLKELVDALNAYLLASHAQGIHNVLIIDEAQSLSADVLEQLRLLTNLETNERKLLQIVLIGQPELREVLAAAQMQQLSQRVIARYHLDALSAEETAQYVRHRMTVAGLKSMLPFDQGALRRIHQLSVGVPRRINLICDRALLGAFARGSTTINRQAVELAAGEVLDPIETGRRRQSMLRRLAQLFGTALVGAAIATGVWFLTMPQQVRVQTNPSPLAPPADERMQPPSTSAANAEPSSPPSLEQRATASGSPPEPRASEQPDMPPDYDLAMGFSSLINSDAATWQALALLWGQSLPAGEPCLAAATIRLKCFRSTGATLSLVRQLDRPAILVLRDAAGRSAPLLLLGLSQRDALIGIDGRRHRISLFALADFWRGEYATFWRTPADLSDSGASLIAATGQRADPAAGAALNTWLAQSLASVAGQPAPASGAVDTVALKEQVHAFQIANGLPSDGIPGPMTLMQLNRAIGVEEPSLERGQAGR